MPRPQLYRASQFEAAQTILEATADVDETLAPELVALRTEALALVTSVMRNGLRPPPITEAGEIVPN